LGIFKKYREEQEAAQKAKADAELQAAILDLIPIAEGASAPTTGSSLVLHPGERLVSTIVNGGLFEPRREPGHWSGQSAGFSVPVVDGIRFRIGKSGGTYVQGAEKPTIIDQGEISFTTQRAVFLGAKYTREWIFSNLIGITHDVKEPSTAIRVSNREKTSGIVYTGLTPEAVRLRLAVAIAIFNGESQEVAKELHDELSSQASAPAPATPGPDDPSTKASAQPSATPATPPPTLPPPPGQMWAKDPSSQHQYRFFDGKMWTDFVADNGQESRDPLSP
jgi:Protein of unknown function (DUF2510)